MNFQQKQVDSIELASLRNQLFKKHCIVSVPFIILIFTLIILLSFFIINPEPPQPPQFIVPSLLQTHFYITIKFIHFYNQIFNSIYSHNITTRFSELQSPSYRRPKTQLYCLVGTQNQCNIFSHATRLTWRYQNVPSLSLLVKRIVMCDVGSVLICAGSVEKSAISNEEMMFIQQRAGKNGVDTEKVVEFGEMHFISYLENNKIIMITLKNLTSIFEQMMKDSSQSFIENYKIELTYPIYNLIAEYPSGIQQFQHQQILPILYSSSNKKCLQFQVSFTRISEPQKIGRRASMIAIVIFIWFLGYVQRKRITNWVHTNFARKKLINQLYKYTIRDVFSGQKPSISNVLQKGPTSQMFKSLSSLVDKTISPIQIEPQPKTHKQPFKFLAKINEIIEQYKNSIKGVMISKNRYLLSNRFNIQTYINDFCQAQFKIMKQYYLRCNDLEITESFFLFAYVGILKSPQKFLKFMQENNTPLPQKLQTYFIKINQHIHQVDSIRQKIQSFPVESDNPKYSFTLEEENQIEQNKEELEIRIRVILIPKYLAILKDLDIQSTYVKKLGLEKQIQSLTEIIQNTRYLLTKHNKSIRAFGK